ncbi:hypothetical protein E4U41_001698 [Claviceps citrina]|nr:hypothetical protein E4U41_001698 [Claviceps citrina]
MSASKTTVTVSYRRRGLAPPLLVAGSFTDPAWEAQEMHSVTDESGEHHFTIQVPVEPGKEYQYKFRASDADDWFVDEHATVALDAFGQRCNLLRVPLTSNTGDRVPTPLVEATEQASSRTAADEKPATAASGSESLRPTGSRDQRTEGERRPVTPAKQVAAVAAEVADTAANLDRPDLKPSPLVLPRDDVPTDATMEEQIDTPLFAHESFGNYQLPDDELDRNDALRILQPPTSVPSDSGGSGGDDVDVDDPTLEKFPSDKESVLDTLRKIQSSTEEGHAVLDDGQHSAAVTSTRTSMDSSDEYDFSRSPPSRMRENRTSRSSFGRPRSAVSLSCIAEEPKSPEDANSSFKDVKKNETHTVSANGSSNDGTEDDACLTINTAKV